MNAMTGIAQRRVDLLIEDDPNFGACYARRDAIKEALVKHGTSAVAVEELRILEELLDGLEADQRAEQAAEIAAEYAWLRAAEMGTAEDYAFEQYERSMGLS